MKDGIKRVAVLLANGFEEIEALTPVDYLRRAGAEVSLVATGTSSRSVTGSHGINVTADINLDSYLASLRDSLPDAVIVPGGMPGSVNVSESRRALVLINEMFKAEKLVCAICAAPAVVLSRTEVLTGKKWTCYPGMENHSEESKKYAALHEENVPFVVDGNLITSRGPGTAEQFAMKIVETLFDAATSLEIAKTAVQR